MRLLALLALFTTSLFAGPNLAADEKKDDKKRAEAEWAQDVVVDFLKALQAERFDQAIRMLTPDTAKQYNRVPDVPMPLSFGRMSGWEFDAEKVSPDKDEVAVRGRIKGKDEKVEYTSAFTIRVVKSTEPGRWRIDYFLFDKCKELPMKK